MLTCARFSRFFRSAPCGSSDLHWTQRLRTLSSPSTRSKLSGNPLRVGDASNYQDALLLSFFGAFRRVPCGFPSRAAVTAHPRLFRLVEPLSLKAPVCGWQLHLPRPWSCPGYRCGRGNPAEISKAPERYMNMILSLFINIGNFIIVFSIFDRFHQ